MKLLCWLFLAVFAMGKGTSDPLKPVLAQLKDASECRIDFQKDRLSGIVGIVFERKPKLGEQVWIGVPATGAQGLATITQVEVSPIDGWEITVDPKTLPFSPQTPNEEISELEAVVLYPAPAVPPKMLAPDSGSAPKGVYPSQILAWLDLDGDGQSDLLIGSNCCKGPGTQEAGYVACPDDLTCFGVWRLKGGVWTLWINRPPC